MAPLTIPLFPLGTVLFPDGVLPLRIFEPRYLDMVAKAISSQTAFGVVAILQGSEVLRPGESVEFAEVGTLASISAWSASQRGQLEILCDGTSRFRTLGCRVLPSGLWMAEVELLAPDHLVEVPEDLLNCAHAFEAAAATMRAAAEAGQIPPWREPLRLDDSGWLANRWCELLPLPIEQKARMLGLDNPVVRLELMQDALEELGWLGDV